ncbi:MAG: hypothetical protein GY805_23560 [Chloroflexi bacterium]|nr:hypothetical protein [Chloroflexota bacterium]
MFDHLLLTIVIGIVLAGQLEVFWLSLGRGHRGQPKKTKAVKEQSQTTAPTKRQPCPACAAAQEPQKKEVATPDEPPAMIEQTRGRPRSVDTSSHFCPRKKCRYYGWLGQGNIRANGYPNGGRWRQLQCVVCNKNFMETTNTIFYGKKAAARTIWQALKALAEGLDIRATARVFDLDPNTVERWLGQAAEHMEAVSAYLIHDLELTQVQVDELWALLGRRDNNEGEESKQRGKRWVWAGIDPVSKLMLGYVVGDRSLDCTQLLIHMIAALLAPGCVPLFISDGWSAYGTALLTHFGHWVQMPRRHKRGASPKPRWQLLPELQYAQVVKKRVKGRVASVSHRVIYGHLEAITTALTNSIGQVINTAFIERLNLNLRQHVPALGRKVMSLAKGEPGLKRQLTLAQAYYNFCLPHFALRLPLLQPAPTKGNGSPKVWQSRTPAMAAGITNQVCQLEELLLFRPPFWQQPVAVAA